MKQKELKSKIEGEKVESKGDINLNAEHKDIS